ncbi:hypothetical protein [Paracoccus pacificus]|uniref:Uncharacterized protein n=1 Tax=Paracoccus pacificus TaxID=1463598 RepID=A0ABW4R2W8_9RHOB
MMRGAVLPTLIAASAFAQPALATRNTEGLVITTFIQRCLEPMRAGKLPDVSGLKAAEGSPAPGTPGSDITYANVDGPMSMRVQTIRAGMTSCDLAVDLTQGFDLGQVSTVLAGQLHDADFKPKASCDSGAIREMRVFEGPASADGSRLGVLSFVISLGDPSPDQLNLIVAESDQPVGSGDDCTEPSGAMR